MRKLSLTPLRSSYDARYPTSGVYTKLNGGLGRLRLDKVGSAYTVRVAWTLNDAQYQYFSSFWRVTSEGTDKFLIDLVTGSHLIEEHVALFLPGSVRLVEVSAATYDVSATLEVEPISYSDDMDESVVDLYEAYGDAVSELLARLATFANSDLVVPAVVV